MNMICFECKLVDFALTTRTPRGESARDFITTREQ